MRHTLLILSAYLCFINLSESHKAVLEVYGGNAVINVMIAASFVAWAVCLSLKIRFMNGIFKYSISEIIKDVTPYLIISVVMVLTVWQAKMYMDFGPLPRMMASVFVGVIVYFIGLKIINCDILDELSILKKKKIKI